MSKIIFEAFKEVKPPENKFDYNEATVAKCMNYFTEFRNTGNFIVPTRDLELLCDWTLRRRMYEKSVRGEKIDEINALIQTYQKEVDDLNVELSDLDNFHDAIRFKLLVSVKEEAYRKATLLAKKESTDWKYAHSDLLDENIMLYDLLIDIRDTLDGKISEEEKGERLSQIIPQLNKLLNDPTPEKNIGVKKPRLLKKRSKADDRKALKLALDAGEQMLRASNVINVDVDDISDDISDLSSLDSKSEMKE